MGNRIIGAVIGAACWSRRNLFRPLAPLLTTAVVLASLHSYSAPSLEATELHFIDLQQEGAAVLVIQDLPGQPKKYILIDTGQHSATPGKGGAKVKEYLASNQISKLDYVILTHLDADHAQGLRTLFLGAPMNRGPPVEFMVRPAVSIDRHGKLERELDALTVAQSGTVVTPSHADAMRKLADLGITVQSVKWPHPSKANDTSLVVGVRDTVTSQEYLVTGDMTTRTWGVVKDMLPSKVVALHAPHHGGDPVVLKVLEQMQIESLVIQANQGNRYGHPQIGVMRDLARIGVEPIMAELQGSRMLPLLVDNGVSAEAAQRAALSKHGDGGRARAMAHLTLSGMSSSVAGRGQPLAFNQVFVTGDVGSVVVSPGGVKTERILPESQRFLLEAAWNELKYMSDQELARFKSFREVQAYCLFSARPLLEAAHKQLGAEYWRGSSAALREPWLLELEQAAARVAGLPSANRELVGPMLERFLATKDYEELAVALVGTKARANQLMRVAEESHRRQHEAVMWDYVNAAWRGKEPRLRADEFRSFRKAQEQAARERGERVDLRVLESMAKDSPSATMSAKAPGSDSAPGAPAETPGKPKPPSGPGIGSGPGVTATPHAVYFYFTPEGCPHCRTMARTMEQLYQASKKGDPRADVYGVPINGSAADVAAFRQETGFSAPVVAAAGLGFSVDTSKHPVTVLYNRATKAHSVGAVGNVPYDTVRGATRAFAEGKKSETLRGSS